MKQTLAIILVLALAGIIAYASQFVRSEATIKTDAPVIYLRDAQGNDLGEFTRDAAPILIKVK